MSNVHVSGPPIGGPEASARGTGEPPAVRPLARARAIRERLRNPPNAVVDSGIDLKPKKIAPAPEPPSDPRARRGHFVNSAEPAHAPSRFTVAGVLNLDRQINTLIAELDRLYALREQQYLAALHRRPASQTILRMVAKHYHVTLVDLVSARRDHPLAFVRQVAMYLARQQTPLSLPAIGRLFGGRDHTTVLHATRKIAALRERDADLNETLEKLAALIAPPATAG